MKRFQLLRTAHMQTAKAFGGGGEQHEFFGPYFRVSKYRVGEMRIWRKLK